MRNRDAPAAVVIVMAAILAGCIRAVPLHYDQGVDGEPPVRFLDRSELKKPFRLVGEVVAEVGISDGREETIIDMKAVAQRMGGDALIDFERIPRFGIPAGSELWRARVITFTIQTATGSRELTR